MAPAKLTLSGSKDIPFNRLVLSQANVRHVAEGVSIEDLAEDIARRTLLQSLSVRPVRDANGVETGIYEVPAGGRRFRALERLVRQKRLMKTALVPCVVRDEGLAEEDSLAENVQRAPLHPLDQYRAFAALREKGRTEEEIAASFFVGVAVVRQRLRLAAVSPALLERYAADELSLDQLMAFTVSDDHARQEQVWDRLKGSYSRDPAVIRRLLTESTVRASDRRARFVGLDEYVGAGGKVTRDLFQADDGGWLQDAALLDRLVATRLEAAADAVRAEGWRWVEVAIDLPYGHNTGFRQLRGESIDLTAEEEIGRDALLAEQAALETTFEAMGELSEETDRRLGAIEAQLAAFDARPLRFEPDEVARAGAFVSLDSGGCLRIERGYVRPEDEPVSKVADLVVSDIKNDPSNGPMAIGPDVAAATSEDPSVEPEEEDGMRPLSDRLMSELTAHRTLALRYALGDQPEVALLAALHAVCLKTFFRYAPETCLELDLRQAGFAAQPPGLGDSAVAVALETRHQAWAATLPRNAADLWAALQAFDRDSREALFAHCIALSVNAVFEPYNRRPRALAHADRLAEAVQLDMVTAGWVPTAAAFLGRVTKARIVEAVREGCGDRAAEAIALLKKTAMADQAETLLAGSGWLPEPLRTPVLNQDGSAGAVSDASSSIPADVGAAGDDGAVGNADTPSAHATYGIAAE